MASGGCAMQRATNGQTEEALFVESKFAARCWDYHELQHVGRRGPNVTTLSDRF